MLTATSYTSTLSDSAGENQREATVGPDPPLPINYEAFLVTILTFDIPTFHASLATRAEDSMFELKTAVPVWEAVRNLASVLLAALVATSFKESTQVNPTCWFFIAASVLQASMALICSTIFIIFFSSDRHKVSLTYHCANQRDVPHEKYLLVDVGGLRFLCWSVWDHFPLPGIWSVWFAMLVLLQGGIVLAVLSSRIYYLVSPALANRWTRYNLAC
ncbi:hypothetical protein F5887DRAFT_913454 [Amanita rubescens]|nr:hypothetical protein F5887DRAFT_913454 [Amanita rubescens]